MFWARSEQLSCCGMVNIVRMFFHTVWLWSESAEEFADCNDKAIIRLIPIMHSTAGYEGWFRLKMCNACCTWVGSHSRHKQNTDFDQNNWTMTSLKRRSEKRVWFRLFWSVPEFIVVQTNQTNEETAPHLMWPAESVVTPSGKGLYANLAPLISQYQTFLIKNLDLPLMKFCADGCCVQTIPYTSANTDIMWRLITFRCLKSRTETFWSVASHSLIELCQQEGKLWSTSSVHLYL